MPSVKRSFIKFDEKSKREESHEGLKWIHVSLVVYFEGTKKQILEIAEDITNIINNTHSVMNLKGQVYGYINPYLGLNVPSGMCIKKGRIKNVPLLVSDSPKELIISSLTRPFYPIIEKTGERWKLIFVPEKTSKKDKTNLYSIENLSYDLWILAGASNLICERYGVIIGEERPSYTPIMIDGLPAIELHDHLLVIRYFVHDRIANARKNPELDDLVLGHGESIFDVIRRISKHEPNSEWAKSAKKFLDRES